MSAATDYRFDIFLRYHRAQARWTRRLAERLDREGFRVWFEPWMLQPGDDRRLELQAAIEECRWIALVLSEEFVANPWPKDELYSGFPQAPRRQNARLLPLLYEPCDLPEPVQDLDLGVDFTGSEEDPILFDYQIMQLMSILDPGFVPPQDLQRFRLENRTVLSATDDEEIRGFQAFVRSIQVAISRVARGEGIASPEEGMQQITLLQFIQRLFQWNTADLHYDRAEEWFRKGIYPEALASYDRALNADPNFALAWSRRGDTLVRMGRYWEAIDSLNGSLSINPYDETTRLRLALIQGRLQQHKGAVVNYDKVLESNPEDWTAWHNRGVRLLQLDRPKLATNSFNRAIRFEKRNPKIWMARGYGLLALKRFPQAERSFAQVLEIMPNNRLAWRSRGDARLRSGRARSAVDCYKRCLKLRRKDPIAWHNLGFSLMQLGQLRTAVDVLEQAILYNDRNPKTWHTRGLLFQQMDYWKLALDHFDTALEIQSDYFPALYARAVALQALDRHEEALHQFEQILITRTKSFACLFGQITSLRKLGRWDQALDLCQQMIQHNDQDPWGWFALAITHGDRGQEDLAIQYYTKVLELTPEDSVALNNRAWIHCERGAFAEALTDVKQAIELEGSRPGFWHTLGRAQAGLDQIAEAQASYETALQIDPEFTPAQQGLQALAIPPDPIPMPDLSQLQQEVHREVHRSESIEPPDHPINSVDHAVDRPMELTPEGQEQLYPSDGQTA